MSNEMPKDEILSEEQLDAVAGGVVMNFDDGLGGGGGGTRAVGTLPSGSTSSTTGAPTPAGAAANIAILRQAVAAQANVALNRPSTTPTPATNNITITRPAGAPTRKR